MQPQLIKLLSVLIVEDDPGSRARLTGLVRAAAEPDARIECVADLQTARARLSAQSFALALVDVQLPDGSGIDLVAWMTRHVPNVQSVIVSAWAEEETILAALCSGAIGYLLKSSDDDELRISLRSLQRGGAPIDPMIARRILELLPPATKPPQAVSGAQLSERELEILRMVAQGFSNREIAGLVNLSPLTVECHTKNIYRKLAVHSRTAAVFEARAMGLMD